jgi:quercetin dioxygenase-like cupin family protein
MRSVSITRRRIFATAVGLPAMAAAGVVAGQTSGAAEAQQAKILGIGSMKITRNASQPSSNGPAEYFTGSVRIDSPFQSSQPARVGGAFVTFEPGARTAWHTHPLGQILIVTSGCGWVQVEGGTKEEVRPGDVVWFPPSTRHWHGATPTTAMSHIAIAEALDGKSVDWMEGVTDAQYGN